MPVHLYGQPADMTPLLALAERHHLAVVEDCAQAHLASSEGRPVGTMGVAGAFSFYPTKNLGALGDGGAVITSDAALAARIKRLRNGGQTSRYHHLEFGVNSRLDEMQAAILAVRLAHLPGWTTRRRTIAAAYRRQLAADGIAVPREFDSGHVYHLFPLLAPDRQAVQTHLEARGIETFIHYPVPIPRQPALATTDPRQCPAADRICAEVLSLPLYPALTDADIAAVVDAVNRYSPSCAS
jgi:dTDP-4-amino-4,6-dideoxygalactose transaminase